MHTKVLYVLLALFVALSGALGGKVMADRPDGSPTAVDVVLRPEWAAVQAVDKNFYSGGGGLVWGDFLEIPFIVPAGKTLYITHFSVSARADGIADADKNQICVAYIRNVTLALILYTLGGNGGGSANLTKAIRINSGEQVIFHGTNYAAHDSTVYLSAGGYLD